MSNCNLAFKPSFVESPLSPFNIEYADASVMEVFRVALGFEIVAVQTSNLDQGPCGIDERTAIVGFSGAMRGSFQVRINSSAVRSIASAMLDGASVEEDDDSTDDALGEICNMIAGGWKNAVPAFSECALTPPTVISGHNYKVRFHKPSILLSRIYKFNGHILHLILHCETMGTPNK